MHVKIILGLSFTMCKTLTAICHICLYEFTDNTFCGHSQKFCYSIEHITAAPEEVHICWDCEAHADHVEKTSNASKEKSEVRRGVEPLGSPSVLRCQSDPIEIIGRTSQKVHFLKSKESRSRICGTIRRGDGVSSIIPVDLQMRYDKDEDGQSNSIHRSEQSGGEIINKGNC